MPGWQTPSSHAAGMCAFHNLSGPAADAASIFVLQCACCILLAMACDRTLMRCSKELRPGRMSTSAVLGGGRRTAGMGTAGNARLAAARGRACDVDVGPPVGRLWNEVLAKTVHVRDLRGPHTRAMLFRAPMKVRTMRLT